MIEMLPDKNSIFEDQALRLVLSFCGQSVKDSLLYEGKAVYPIGGLSGSGTSVSDGRHNLVLSGCDNPGNRQAEGFSA